MKILIAEDDHISRSILTGILPTWGYEVEAVSDGLQAFAQLTAPDAPKLAILDWLMPGLNGVDVCRQVRQLPTSEPPYLVLLTAMEQKNHIVSGLQAGANDYITKPYDPDELRARLAVGTRVIELQEILVRRVAELEAALTEIRTLQGILPICMHCHKIRTDKESWQQLESYISERSLAKFSHGICPSCVVKFYDREFHPDAIKPLRPADECEAAISTVENSRIAG